MIYSLRKRATNLLPALVVLVVAIWSVWPVVRCPVCVSDFGRDGLLINWIINTAGRNIYGLHLGMGGGLFNGSIFYPYINVLAYSEMFFITAFWTYPVAKMLNNPGVVSGLALVVGQVLTLLVIYQWWRQITKNGWSSAIATVAFGLSQIRFEYQVHLQMWSIQYWLISMWLITSWWEDRKSWKLFVGAGLLGLQVWESLLPLYFAGLVLGAKCLSLRLRIKWKQLLAAGMVFGIIAVWPLLAYWGVAREFHYQRSIRDAANNSLAVNDIWGEFASPGLYVLFAIAMWRLRISTHERWKEEKWLVLVLVFGLIMALGPVLKWGRKTVKIGGKVPIPLPYSVVYYAVPGFGALRTPSRWIWVAGWAASGLVAIALTKTQNVKVKKQTIGITGAMILAIVGGTRILKVRGIPGLNQTPVVYKWLATQPGKVIAILPMYPDEEEINRLPFSYIHQKLTLNGFSGFYPPDRIKEAVKWTADFPSTEVLAEMKTYGTDYVIVEKARFKNYDLRIMDKAKVWEDKDYLVVRI